jgi:hypothetical protein
MQMCIQLSYRRWQFANIHIDVSAVYSTYVDMLLIRLWYLYHGDVL